MFDTIDMFVYIAGGIYLTLQYSVISLFIGTLISLFITYIKFLGNRYINIMCNIYISIFRGTPLLVQLYLIYYCTPTLLNINLSGYEAGIITFSLNSGAYLSEVIRAGINSIGTGQFLAIKSFKIPRFRAWLDIILPQALKNISPSLINEMSNLVKETAIISLLGESDIMRRADLIRVEYYDFLQPLLIAALYYYMLTSLLSLTSNYLEKKFKYDNN